MRKNTPLATFNTAPLDAMIEGIVADRVKEIIEKRMGDIVAGEFAKMKLTGKNPPVIMDLIEKRVDRLVTRFGSEHTVKNRIDYLLRSRVQQICETKAYDLANKIRDELSKRATELFRE